MKTITSGWVRASFTMAESRSSKAPRYSVPPSRAPTLSSTMRLPPSTAASLPWAPRMASASAIAVLPTPASPTSTGLFFVLRARVWITSRISRLRPMTGPRSPFAARAVRSRPKRSRVGVSVRAPALSRPRPLPRAVSRTVASRAALRRAAASTPASWSRREVMGSTPSLSAARRCALVTAARVAGQGLGGCEDGLGGEGAVEASPRRTLARAAAEAFAGAPPQGGGLQAHGARGRGRCRLPPRGRVAPPPHRGPPLPPGSRACRGSALRSAGGRPRFVRGPTRPPRRRR